MQMAVHTQNGQLRDLKIIKVFATYKCLPLPAGHPHMRRGCKQSQCWPIWSQYLGCTYNQLCLNQRPSSSLLVAAQSASDCACLQDYTARERGREQYQLFVIFCYLLPSKSVIISTDRENIVANIFNWGKKNNLFPLWPKGKFTWLVGKEAAAFKFSRRAGLQAGLEILL